MAGDVLLVRPNVGGIGVDIGELWRRIKGKAPDPVEQVAIRFVELFDAHGVAVTQIPRLVPEIALAQLASPKDLLSVLTGPVLDAVCALFGIRREWLEGQGDDIYDCCHCHNSPQSFFTELGRLSSPATIAVVRAVTTADPLDYRSSSIQRVELVMVEAAGWIGAEKIERYRVFSDGWDWRYREHRIQLKAMIRTYGRPVPLYRVKPEEVEKLYAGTIVPGTLMRGPLCTNPSLEDYCMSTEENVQAKEIDELNDVIRYQDELLAPSR